MTIAIVLSCVSLNPVAEDVTVAAVSSDRTSVNGSIITTDIRSCSNLASIVTAPEGFSVSVTPSGAGGLIGTGSTVQLYSGTTIVNEFTVVVKSDLNGDGVCDALDCMLANLLLNGHLSLSECYMLAANYDGIKAVSTEYDMQQTFNCSVRIETETLADGTAGFNKVGNDTYYLYSDGSVAKGFLQSASGTWYYFEQSGKMVTSSWVEDGGSKYYFDQDGAICTGFKYIDGEYYYFKTSSGDVGAMQTGWVQIESYWYYFYPDSGIMAHDTTVTVNGYDYVLDSQGRWIK